LNGVLYYAEPGTRPYESEELATWYCLVTLGGRWLWATCSTLLEALKGVPSMRNSVPGIVDLNGWLLGAA